MLVVHEPHPFAVPPDLAEPDRMTLVTSLEAKLAASDLAAYILEWDEPSIVGP